MVDELDIQTPTPAFRVACCADDTCRFVDRQVDAFRLGQRLAVNVNGLLVHVDAGA